MDTRINVPPYVVDASTVRRLREELEPTHLKLLLLVHRLDRAVREAPIEGGETAAMVHHVLHELNHLVRDADQIMGWLNGETHE